MNKRMILASVAVLLLAGAAPSFADSLNPQPEPPGRHKLHATGNNQHNTIGSATGGAGSGKTSTIGSATGGAGSGKAAVHSGAPLNPAVTHGFNPQPDPPGTPAPNTQGQH